MRLYGLYARLSEAAKALFGTGKKRNEDSGVGGRFANGGMGYGYQQWSGNPLQQVTEYRNWTYTAVRFRGIARQTPPVVVIAHQEGEQRKYLRERQKAFRDGRDFIERRFVRTKSHPIGARVGTDLEYLPADAPANKLLHNPNGPMIGTDLWYLASVFEDLTGRVHLWKVRDGAGRVDELWVLPTPWVFPVAGTDRIVDYYRVTFPNGGSEAIDADDIITIGEPTPFGYLAWYSPTQAHGLNIDLFNALVVARFNGMTNGANVGSMVEVPESMYKDDAVMQRFEQMLMSRYSGVVNYNRPIIAAQGSKLTNLTPQMELAFSESAKVSRQDIFAAFDLDESVMGYANQSTYAASIVTDRNVYKKIVMPYHERRNATITERLLVPDFSPDYVAINEQHAETSPEERRADFEFLSRIGATSVNEVRTEFGLEPFDDPRFDEPMPVGMSGGGSMIPLGDMELNDPAPTGSNAVEGRSRMISELFSTNGTH